MGCDWIHWNWNVLHRISSILAGAKFGYDRHDAGWAGYVPGLGLVSSTLSSTQEARQHLTNAVTFQVDFQVTGKACRELRKKWPNILMRTARLIVRRCNLMAPRPRRS
jgi:hypothetical protein